MPGRMKNSKLVKISVCRVARKRKRFLRREKSAIAPSTGIVSATMIAETLTARVHMTVPVTSSDAMAFTK